jgi:hypothetical protein
MNLLTAVTMPTPNRNREIILKLAGLNLLIRRIVSSFPAK